MTSDHHAWDEDRLRQIYLGSMGKLLFDIANIDADSGYEMLKGMGHPVTSAHIKVMPHIDIDGTRLTELARRAHLTKQSAWELIKNMETHGYLERSVDLHDARAIRISYTKKGIEFFRDVCAGLAIREDDVAARIGKANAKCLKSLLAKLRQSYADRPPAMTELTASLKAARKTKQVREKQ